MKPLIVSPAKKSSSERGGLLKQIRKEHGFSQQQLALRLGLTRVQLQRLEAKETKQLSVYELCFISDKLLIPLTHLFRAIDITRQTELIKHDHEKPEYRINFAEGVSIAVLGAHPERIVGRIEIAPKAGFSNEKMRNPHYSFWLLLKGKVLVVLGAEEKLFKAQESFSLINPLSYEICNPQPFESAQMMLVAMPPFIHL